ncbi:MAG: hypothetical protein QOI82_107 [Actinomycetota bacterium]|nr:hypothetical protein [Actinomycetota bacterium]
MTARPEAGAFGLLITVTFCAGAIGLLTAFAQQWLPKQIGSLANSAGPWAVVAFALALPARRAAVASGCSVVALASLVVGYYATDRLRGFPASSRTVILWLVVAVVAGPVLGLAANWCRHGNAAQALLGALVPALLLIAEGSYGLTVIADTTYPPYWRLEIGTGLGLLAVTALSAGRRHSRT